MIFCEFMVLRRAAVLLLFLLTSPAARAGTISGRVVLLKNGKELADASNAVVFVEGTRAASASDAGRGEMKSASKRFQPRVVAVSTKGTVEFPNADPIYHNVFSVSGNNRFDLGLYRSGASKSKTFEEPGLVRVYCNIHPQMVGFVMVVDSDLVAVTGPDGAFRFDGVPSGARVVRAWHEEGGDVRQPVTVGGGAEPALSIRIDVSGFKRDPHKNKYGKEYKPPPNDSEDERY
jgi:plastocyanin